MNVRKNVNSWARLMWVSSLVEEVIAAPGINARKNEERTASSVKNVLEYCVVGRTAIRWTPAFLALNTSS